MTAPTCLTDEDLSRLWDGDLTADRRDTLQQHLASCPSCKARWEQMAAGARYLDEALGIGTEAEAASGCPSLDLIAGYLSDALDATERQTVEDHLSQCPRCRDHVQEARQLSDAYAEEGEAWWQRYVGLQIFRLVVRVPEEAENLASAVGAVTAAPSRSAGIIKLPILEPIEAAPRRLAAGTGEGFSEQVLRQDDPPFEIRVVQFGQELRIHARALGDDSAHRVCLARLELTEVETRRLSRVVLVEDGEVCCVFKPEEVGSGRPQETHLTATLQPLVTLEQLAEAGSEAYLPILQRLLGHEDAAIRSSAVQVLARVARPEAPPLIEPLLEDDDETVRTAARRALKQLIGR